MKVIVALVVIIELAIAAPTDENNLKDSIQRTKKSPYGAPCAGAAPAQPIALYLAPQPATVPHYREDEKVVDGLFARTYYGASASASESASAASQSAPTPAIGVFPSAKVGNCAVPILLSCSPKVVSGHLEESKSDYPAYKSNQENEDHTFEKERLDKVWVEKRQGADAAKNKMLS